MTDYETTQLERIKAYLDKEGMSYHTHTENAVEKHAKSNITIHGYNIYIRLSDNNDNLFRRKYKGRKAIVLYPDKKPDRCLRIVKFAVRQIELAHEEEKQHRRISHLSSADL